MPRRLPALLLLLSALVAPAAQAERVHRCVDAEGRAVYSDQPCETQQALPRAAPGDAAVAEFAGGFTAPDCARTPAALRAGVRDALAAGDANRLAGYYHWPGTSTRGGRQVMDELEALAARPLLGIDWWPPAGTGDDRPADAPWPVLRVEQGGGVGHPAALVTDFRLVRHAGCWWIEL